jgi:two-component system cell cycle sensor histidine kinase/response regulator CckA
MGITLRLVNPTPTFDPELLSAAFEKSSEGLAIADPDRILYANAAFAEIFGYSDPSEITGTSFAGLRPTGQQCSRGSSLEASHDDESRPLCEFLGRRKDGSKVPIEASCSTFRSQGRDLVVLTVRDVGQRERRRIVRDSDRRFRTIFKAAPIGIVQCSHEGQVLETNPAVERMLGYSRSEFRGTQFRDLLHPEDREKDGLLFEELAKGEREAYEHEVRYLGKGDLKGWMRLKMSLVRGCGGGPQFAIAMLEDITERKRAEQRLREAEKMEAVGRLVGGVAHDFNNLLTGIMLYCDLLRAGLDPGSSLHHHAEEIRMAGEQGAALIQQLLAISRQQPLEPRILCLNEIIGGTWNLLGRLIGEKIELKVCLDPKLGIVKMDPAQIQQILLNLVLNARDAISETGCITVETHNCAFLPTESAVPQPTIPGVMLVVTDTGCGMTSETRAHLFEPFFTTKTPGRGNGLGLATVYNIVRNAGGSIQVESEPGKGARFSVILPRVEQSAVPVPEGRFSPSPVHEMILLVEDNATVRTAAQRILSECGYRVKEAASGSEALSIAQQMDEIDLLLADLVMPGITGRELASRVLEVRPEVRVLYMSGYDPQAGNQNDSIVCFRKPFTGSALLEKVREVLDTANPGIAKKKDQGKREPS